MSARVYETSPEERAARDAREDSIARLAEKFWPVKLQRRKQGADAAFFAPVDFEIMRGSQLAGFAEVRWRHKWHMVYRSFDLDLQKFKRLVALETRKRLPVIVLVRLGVEGTYWFRPSALPADLSIRTAAEGGGRSDRNDPYDRDDQVQVPFRLMESVQLGPIELGCKE